MVQVSVLKNIYQFREGHSVWLLKVELGGYYWILDVHHKSPGAVYFFKTEQ